MGLVSILKRIHLRTVAIHLSDGEFPLIFNLADTRARGRERALLLTDEI